MVMWRSGCFIDGGVWPHRIESDFVLFCFSGHRMDTH